MKKGSFLLCSLLLIWIVLLNGPDRVEALPSTVRVSLTHDGQQANRSVQWPDISNDGRYAVFASTASNLMAESLPDEIIHIFLRDLETGELTLVTRGIGGVQANADSYYPVISGDGLTIAFASLASNLVAGDTNNMTDIFIYHRLSGHISRVSVASDGSQANHISWGAAIAADSSAVAFQSNATNLVADDTNNVQDVFVHDLGSGITERVSLTSAGNQATEFSIEPAISGNGEFVAFTSAADLMGDGNIATAVYLYDRSSETTERISEKDGFFANDDASQAVISDNGRYVAYHSIDDLLVADDTNGVYDVFLYDRNTGETRRVSVDSNGNESDGASVLYDISGDGRQIVFASEATNLVNDDTNNTYDLFVHDAQSGTTSRVSLASDGSEGDIGTAGGAALNYDGYYVIYQSAATNLVPNDTNNQIDIFLSDSNSNVEPITLTVTRITDYSVNLDNADAPDYYVKVWIAEDNVNGSETFNNAASHTQDEANVEPFWVFYRNVDQLSNRTVVIELWDKDDGNPDDLADINPAGGEARVFLNIDGVTGRWDSWPFSCSRGVGDTAVEICWDISIWSASGDADGDGLLDGWEANGVDLDNDGVIDVDLHTMGADPLHKDIFVELDYMVEDSPSIHNYTPSPEALNTIVESFDNAPVYNPDGHSGIHLHLDYGPDAPLVWGDSNVWGSLSGGNALPYQEFLGTCDSSDNYNWSQFDQLKNTHFSADRSPFFHYNMWVGKLCPQFESTSGISRGNGASDFIVSLGFWGTSNGYWPRQAGTFMHELGHNLGLGHGGQDDVNYKPNYLSVMNYLFQMTGLYVDGEPLVYDYARYSLPPLDENDLIESQGISPPAAVGATFGTRYFCGVNWLRNDLSASRVDWNCSGDDTEIHVTHNINAGLAPGDPTLSVLNSQSDWDKLVHKGGSIGGLGTTFVAPAETIVDELTAEEEALIPPWQESEIIYLPVLLRP